MPLLSLSVVNRLKVRTLFEKDIRKQVHLEDDHLFLSELVNDMKSGF
jgi:hypothetical protein